MVGEKDLETEEEGNEKRGKERGEREEEREEWKVASILRRMMAGWPSNKTHPSLACLSFPTSLGLHEDLA